MSKSDLKAYTMQLTMIGFTLMIYIIGLFLTQDLSGWTLGILFGLIIALLKFKLMENTFSKAVTMPEAKARGYTQKHYMLRYLITGAVLLLAAMEPSISLLGVFFGLVSMKVGAYVQLWFPIKR